MKQKIYNFQPRVNQLENDRKGEIIKTRDYFEFYHTGIEELPFMNEQMYFMTNRYENERAEVITNAFYDDADLSDLVLALNNDVYWWDAPYDFDTQYIIADNKVQYVENLRKRKLNDAERLYYNEKFNDELSVINDKQRLIVVPKFKNLARVNRLIQRYLNNRKCT